MSLEIFVETKPKNLTNVLGNYNFITRALSLIPQMKFAIR